MMNKQVHVSCILGSKRHQVASVFWDVIFSRSSIPQRVSLLSLASHTR